jgi:hypothetical protein
MSLPLSRFPISARALLVCAALALPSTAETQARRALPDSLTDREFWELFTTLSEEGGAFPSENFVSNEKTYQFIIPTLQRTLTPNGVYLGVGPEQNFTYIVNLKPRFAVIFDIRRQNAITHLMYKALFELAPTRADFVARLFSRPLPSLPASTSPTELFAAVSAVAANDSAFAANWAAIVRHLTATRHFALSPADLSSMRHVLQAFFEAGPDISYAFRVGAPPPSVTAWFVTYAQLQSLTNADGANMAFLASEDSYRWLRVMQRRNLIVPVVGDFAGPRAIRDVGKYLHERGAVVTAFYTSNVEQYLFTGFDSDQRFYRNVEALPLDSTSTFIRSLPSGNIVGLVPNYSFATIRNSTFRITDSAGVRIMVVTGTDSAGKPMTQRVVTPIPPPAPTAANNSAFITGLAPMRATLDAFAAGRLRTYQQVTAMTKTDGWK